MLAMVGWDHMAGCMDVDVAAGVEMLSGFEGFGGGFDGFDGLDGGGVGLVDADDSRVQKW